MCFKNDRHGAHGQSVWLQVLDAEAVADEDADEYVEAEDEEEDEAEEDIDHEREMEYEDDEVCQRLSSHIHHGDIVQDCLWSAHVLFTVALTCVFHDRANAVRCT